MEILFQRFSHLSKAIFNCLGNKSLVKCKEVSEIWRDYISEENFYLIRIIRSTVAKFHNVGKDWENVFKKGEQRGRAISVDTIHQFLVYQEKDDNKRMKSQTNANHPYHKPVGG